MEMVLTNNCFEQMDMREIITVDGGRTAAGDVVIICCTVIGVIGGGAAGGLAGAGVGVAIADYYGI